MKPLPAAPLCPASAAESLPASSASYDDSCILLIPLPEALQAQSFMQAGSECSIDGLAGRMGWP